NVLVAKNGYDATRTQGGVEGRGDAARAHNGRGRHSARRFLQPPDARHQRGARRKCAARRGHRRDDRPTGGGGVRTHLALREAKALTTTERTRHTKRGEEKGRPISGSPFFRFHPIAAASEAPRHAGQRSDQPLEIGILAVVHIVDVSVLVQIVIEVFIVVFVIIVEVVVHFVVFIILVDVEFIVIVVVIVQIVVDVEVVIIVVERVRRTLVLRVFLERSRQVIAGEIGAHANRAGHVEIIQQHFLLHLNYTGFTGS